MIVLLRCSELRSCSIDPSVTIFGDSCPGTPKYLEVQYSCVQVNMQYSCPGTPKYLEVEYTCVQVNMQYSCPGTPK